MSPALAIPFIGLSGLIPLAGGLTIPFLGGQKTDKQPLNLFPDNTGINFEASPSISNPFDFQKLLNLGKKDTFTEDFLQGKTTDKYPMSSEAVQGLKDQATLFNKDGDYVGGVLPSGIVESNPFDFQKLLDLGKKDTFTTDKYPMSSEAVQGLKDQATLFNKDGDYVGGVLPSGIVESKPNTMLQEQNQILGADGRPIVKVILHLQLSVIPHQITITIIKMVIIIINYLINYFMEVF